VGAAVCGVQDALVDDGVLAGGGEDGLGGGVALQGAGEGIDHAGVAAGVRDGVGVDDDAGLAQGDLNRGFYREGIFCNQDALRAGDLNQGAVGRASGAGDVGEDAGRHVELHGREGFNL